MFACGGPSTEVIEAGDGPGVQEDHVVYATFTYYKTPRNILLDSRKVKEPATFTIKSTAPDNTLTHYIAGHQVGDSLSFQIMAKKFFTQPSGAIEMPDGVNASDMITFQVRLDSMISPADWEKREAEREALRNDQPRIRLQNKLYETRSYYQDYMNMAGIKERVQSELPEIMRVIQAAGQTAFPTENGVQMVILKEELGDLLNPGDKVSVNYVGYWLDGTFFDTNMKEVARAHNALDPERSYKPLKFNLGTGQVIMGWDEAFKTLSVGTKVVLYIPSPLAYGERGSGDHIPPHMPLKFEIEILSAKKPF